jgi:hypothetical protein
MIYDEYHNVNDTYKIKKDWEEAKKLMSEIEKDIDKFLGPNKTKIRGTKARVKIFKLNKLLIIIARKALKTKQDYNSDYS